MMRKPALLLVTVFVAAATTAVAAPSEDQGIARLSYIEDHVSFQHPGEVDWSPATANMALQVADRLYTGETGRAEIQFDDGSVLRLAEKTDVEILAIQEDLVQVRILLGLASLTARGSVPFEVDTPAAAFTTMEKGAYRFDVVDNGDSDAIVREGLLSAASQKFSSRIEKGEVLHVTPGDDGTSTLARYDQRDSWDEWTDRRDADMIAYRSRQYLPDYVYAGASDLDRYGYWVDVGAYGPAWIPYSVGPGWSPYWDGRWVHRPFWGWTWVSYEPWGWLPYHYGSWYFAANVGWCWLPGPSFGFHFWSPGLVRFYHGPGWVSWCPLGPGDYYDANHYFYRSGYGYHLTNMRLLQHRGPGDLLNRDAPGAVRRMGIEDFVNAGPGGGAGRAQSDPGFFRSGRGREALVTGALPVKPSARSFVADPDRVSPRPARESALPAVVRNVPVSGATASGRFVRAGGTAGPSFSAGSRSPAGTTRETTRPIDQRTWASPPVAGRGETSPDAVRPPVTSGSGSATRIWNRVTPAPENSDRGLPREGNRQIASPRQPAPPARSMENRGQPQRPAAPPRTVEPAARPNPRPPTGGAAVESANPRSRVGTGTNAERRVPASVGAWGRAEVSPGSPGRDLTSPSTSRFSQQYRFQAPAVSGRSYSPAPVTGVARTERSAPQYRATEQPSGRSYQSGVPNLPSRGTSPQNYRAPNMFREAGGPNSPSQMASPKMFRAPGTSSRPAGAGAGSAGSAAGRPGPSRRIRR